MKKSLAFISLVLFCNYYCFSRKKVLQPNVSVDTYPVGGSLKIERDFPLILIGSLETNIPSLVMDPDNLRIVKTYTDQSDIKHFGEKGINGVQLGELKTKVPLLKLEEVLDHFKVPSTDRSLKVLVDKT